MQRASSAASETTATGHLKAGRLLLRCPLGCSLVRLWLCAVVLLCCACQLSSSALERRSEWEDDSSGDEYTTRQQPHSQADMQPRKRVSTHTAPPQADEDKHDDDATAVEDEPEQEGKFDERLDEGGFKHEQQQQRQQPHEDESGHSSEERNGSQAADADEDEPQHPSGGDLSATVGLSEDKDARAKHARFEKLRKQHYNSKMGAALKAHLADT